jgi:hypothetical protein
LELVWHYNVVEVTSQFCSNNNITIEELLQKDFLVDLANLEEDFMNSNNGCHPPLFYRTLCSGYASLLVAFICQGERDAESRVPFLSNSS